MLLAAALAPLAIAAPAGAGMVSVKLPDGTCQTTGGGRLRCRSPASPEERIDRRLLTDLAWLEKRVTRLRHRRLLARPVHAATASTRSGWRSTGPRIGRRHLGRDRRRSPPGPSPSRITRSSRSDGSATTAMRVTASTTTSISRGAIRTPPAAPGYPVRTVYTLRCPSPRRPPARRRRRPAPRAERSRTRPRERQAPRPQRRRPPSSRQPDGRGQRQRQFERRGQRQAESRPRSARNRRVARRARYSWRSNIARTFPSGSLIHAPLPSGKVATPRSSVFSGSP